MNIPAFISKTFMGLLLAIFCTQASAQLSAKKDVFDCAYGLQDKQGNWVIPAMYVNIEKTGFKNFIVFDGLHYGVLDTAGKVLIPVIYNFIFEQRIKHMKERLDPFDSEYFTKQHETKFLFIAQKQGKWGVINDQGQEIIPHEYNRIKIDGDHLMLNKFDGAENCASYAHKTGKILFRDLQGYVYPFEGNSWALFAEKEYTYNDEVRKYGIIDTLGNIIAPMIYNKIDFCKNRFTVQQEGAIGIIDLAGNILLKPEYYIIIHGEPKCISPAETYLINDPSTHKFGFMKGDFTIAARPVYDKAIWVENQKKTFKSSYKVELQQQVGIADENGKITIEPYFNDLIPLNFNLKLIPGINKSGKEKKLKEKSIRKNHFISRKGKKYGLVDEDGHTLIEPEFEYHEWGNTPLFSQGTKLFILDYARQDPQLVEAPLIFSNDSLYLFSVKNDLVPLYTTKASPETLTKFLHLAYRNGSLYCINVLDKRKTVLYTAAGEKLELDNINRFHTEDGNHLVFSCGIKESKWGVLDMQTGKLVLDTIYSSIQFFAEVNQVWASQVDSTGKKTRHLLFDTLGNQRTAIVFDRVPIHIADTLIVRTGNRAGILGKDLQWLVPPVYRDIQKLDNRNFHIVISQNKRIGLVDPEYNLIADTVYTDFMPVSAKLEKPDGQPGWWMLRSDSKRLLFNSNCVLIDQTKNARIDSMLIDFALKGGIQEYQLNRTANDNYSFNIGMDGSKSHLPMHVPFRKEMYALLRKIYERQLRYYPAMYTQTGDLLMPFTTEKQHTGDSLSTFGLLDLGMKYMSVKQSNFSTNNESMYNQYSYQTIYNNYVWQNGTLRKIGIRDIFGAGDLLEKELTSRIHSLAELNLKCSTPSLMVQEIGEKFSLSDKGVILYLLNVNGNKVEILIPLYRLKSNPESAWIVEYLSVGR